MKLSEYIKQLQDMQNKYGDVDVKVRNERECSDLSVEIDFYDPLKPYYNKEEKYVVIDEKYHWYH